jgi:hypothetical protein
MDQYLSWVKQAMTGEEEDEVTDADLKKIEDLIEAKLKEFLGGPYKTAGGTVLTTNQMLAELWHSWSIVMLSGIGPRSFVQM